MSARMGTQQSRPGETALRRDHDHHRRGARPGISLIVRNVLFTVIVPGAGGVAGPWLVLAGSRGAHSPTGWWASIPMLLGSLLYLWAVGAFAVIGRGTPGYWDSPRSFVAAGPYLWRGIPYTSRPF